MQPREPEQIGRARISVLCGGAGRGGSRPLLLAHRIQSARMKRFRARYATSLLRQLSIHFLEFLPAPTLILIDLVMLQAALM